MSDGNEMHTGPEDQIGIPDPMQKFESTVEHVLQQVATELAGLRAERDELRLELERLRTQIDQARAQLDEHEPEHDSRPSSRREHTAVAKKVATWVGVAIAAILVTIVLLISVGPKVAPYHTYVVRSGSMEPTFNTGDLIVLTKIDGSKIKKGDIITFKRPDKPGVLVTHRVVGIETTANGRQFETKGDANRTADGWRVPASRTSWKYRFRIPIAGFVFGDLSTPLARLALVAIPAALLGLLALVLLLNVAAALNALADAKKIPASWIRLPNRTHRQPGHHLNSS